MDQHTNEVVTPTSSVTIQRPQIADIELAKKKREKKYEDKLLRKLQKEFIDDYHLEDEQPVQKPVRDENRTHYEDQLLDKLMQQIESGYSQKELKRKKVRFETLMITSAVPLTEEEKERMARKFIEVAKKPLRRITTVVDPSLITGVRLQSETFYYEVSGQKQLREIRAFLTKSWLQGDES